ncbi:MAG: carboxypeptidase regulatory-like domain-containing protein [Acidobacteria bacterium]|nr:carboxypeptidase regulatory-like domain-containing protein [Acidobacteriota bacterium]
MERFTVAFIFFSAALLAQNSGIQGVVTDPSAAPVPQVHITITNVATGVTTAVQTNERGFYSAPFLPTGTYRIMAERSGFSPVSRDNLKLDVDQIARVDFALKIGTVAETVEVTAASALLESETTTMGQVIENKRIVEMPLNLRNYLELAKLSTGVLPARTLGHGARTAGEDGTEGGFIALGQRAYQTNVLLDGVDNSSRASGGPLGFQAQATKPPVDAIAEFKVVTNNNSAEFGYRMGGKVVVSTKSGSNEMHGTVYEFLRNDKFDGTNFFANRSGSKKPTLRQNQFGGTVGGPVLKNRTFYFFSYQGTRIRRGRSFLSTVPSALARQGDVSLEGTNRNRIFDPLTTTGTGADARRLPFANNRIPASRFDPVVRPIIDQYPFPNVTGREYQPNNYFFAPSDRDTSNQYDVRVDHNFSDRDRTFYRWSIRRDDKLQNGVLPASAFGGGLGQTVDLPSDNITGSWTHSFTPTLYNEARFGFMHYPTRFDILDTENLNKKYGVKGVPGDNFGDGLDHGLARFTPSGYNEIGSRSFWPNRNWLDNLQINDNLLWQKGSHSIKTGVEWRRSDIFREAQRFRRGQFNFSKVFTAEQPNVAASRTATGNGLADMLLGWASGTTVGNQLSEDAISPYWGVYVQDDWKVSRRLTVNAGLRWELFQSPYFPEGVPIGRLGVSRYLTEFNVARTDPRYETFERPKSGRDCGCKQDWNNFAPRLGIAYRLTEKTVVRVGGGIFYGEADYLTSESARWINQTPDFTEVTVNTNNITAAAIVRDGFAPVQLPAAAPVRGTSVEASPDEYPNQYASQWFFDIQRELPGDILIAVGYQGAKGTHLYQGRNINNGGPHPTIPESQRRVRPQWNGVTLRDPGYNSSFNALVAKAEKRFSKGLTFITSYTWSHNIDQGNESLDEGLGGRANQYDLRNERGNASLDRRHNFVGSFTYELPFGRGRTIGGGWNGALNTVLGGWQVGGILSFRTGFPFDVGYPGDPQNSGTSNRGNRTGAGTLPNPTIDKWFDEFAFVASAPGVYGNTGRNVLYGPGSKNFDFILGKRFAMPWEGHSLQFRFESFNFTNTPTFDQPSGGLRGQATATINAADEPRRIQFALKYSF